MRLGLSTSLFPDPSPPHLSACAAAGIDCIEIVQIGKWFDKSLEECRRRCEALAEEAPNAGVEIWSVHLPFGHAWDISSLDETHRLQIIEKHRQLLQISVCLKPTKAVIHASYEPNAQETREERIIACKHSLTVLSEEAQKLGMQLAVECLPRTCIGNCSGDILRLIEGNERIGVCFDTNHLTAETNESFLRALGDRIVTIHVSDYDGIDERHWMPGRGVNNWNEIIRLLTESGYSGPFLFELSQKNAPKPIEPVDVKQCMDRLFADFYKAQKI